MGYHVIPLAHASKACTQRDWQKLRLNVADVGRMFGDDDGVGLLLGTPVIDASQGQPSDLSTVYPVAVDVDVDDPLLIDRVRLAFETPPPAKFGKKGMTYFARTLQPIKKRLWTRQDETSKAKVHTMELLALGQQTVLPPSLHPATRAEYTWVGQPLWDYAPLDLPLLTPQIVDELDVAVKKPTSPIFLLNDMVPSSAGEAGTVHNSTLTAVGALVALGWSDDDIWKRIERATQRVDPDGDRPRWEETVRKMIEDARAKGFANVKKEKPHVVASKWLLTQWKGEGKVRNRDGQIVAYEEGYWRFYGRDDLIHVIAKQYPEPSNVSFCITDWRTVADTVLGAAERFPKAATKPRVCLTNGTFDLETGQLGEWSPDDYLITQLPFAYDAQAECPTYDAVIDRTFAHDDPEEQRRAVQTYEEFVAHTMIECLEYQKFLVIKGDPGTGKSTLLDVLLLLHGGTARTSSVPIHKLADERYLSRLVGKLVNLTGEVEANSHIADDVLKAITSGDPLEIRFLYGTPYSVTLPTRLIFAGNEMFKTRDTTGAIERRMLMLSCNNPVPPEGERLGKQEMMEALRGELPGIFRRMVAAYTRLRQRGCFDQPREAADALSTFSLDNNPVQRWLYERTLQGMASQAPDMKLPKDPKPTENTILFLDFSEWLKVNGHKPMSSVTWGTKLGQFKEVGDIRPYQKWIGGRPIRVRDLTLVSEGNY
jgi:P4 family phage/plasmid primase-like protien